jgi:Sulfotransferase family
MKSGSSTLTKHLRAHPSIFMARKPKEPSYFVERETLREVYPAIEKMGFWKSEKRYLELFADAGDCPVIGEASQNYARLSRVTGVAERIARFNPEARILYIMRDPVERTISHYWYMVNFYGESRTLLKAIKNDRDYCETSYYAMQLNPYNRLFGAERVKTLTLEELRAEPVATIQGIYRWLGVVSDFVPPSVGTRANVTPLESTQVRGLGLLHHLRHSSLWGVVGRLVPQRMRTLARGLSVKELPRGEISTRETKAYLRPIQREQTNELEELLGRTFPEWQTLNAVIDPTQ